jgi:hypothetical protein
MVEISNDLLHNIVLDFRKKDIDKITRAKLLRAYLLENKLSLKSACKKLEMPKTSLHDMLAYESMTPEKLEELKEKGFSTTEIDRAVRSKSVDKLETPKKHCCELDLFLDYAVSKLKEFKKEAKFTSETSVLIANTQAVLKDLEYELRGRK